MKFKNLDTDIYLSFRVQGKQHEWIYICCIRKGYILLFVIIINPLSPNLYVIMVLQCNSRRNIERYVYVSTMYTNEKNTLQEYLKLTLTLPCQSTFLC